MKRTLLVLLLTSTSLCFGQSYYQLVKLTDGSYAYVSVPPQSVPAYSQPAYNPNYLDGNSYTPRYINPYTGQTGTTYPLNYLDPNTYRTH